MVRTIIMLLLLAVFFLSGTLYGMNQDTRGSNESEIEEEVVVVSPNPEQIVEKEIVPTPIVEEDLMTMNNQVHLTQKTASLLETSVQGFYEVVVGVLYQVAEIFF